MKKVKSCQSLSSHTMSTFTACENSKPTNSASLVQAEREIKVLKENNLELKKEITEIRSAYKQLITENSHESYDERRVNFLKAQMVQLERQILLLNEALSSRSSVVLNVENSLMTIGDICRHYLSQDAKIGEVAIAKDDLNNILQTAESARMRLYKNIENTNAENVEKPIVMLERFLRPTLDKPVTLLDVCSGSLEHINLKHVAKLESKLSQLYRQLMLVSQTIHLAIKVDDPQFQQQKAVFESANRGKPTKMLSNGDSSQKITDLPKCLYARLGTQVARACNMLKDATSELLALSILIPSAPWPPLRKPFLKDFTTDAVMSKIPAMSRSKQTAVRGIIESLIKAMNYSCHMANMETRALKEEVTFHQSIYYLQAEYIDDLWKALRLGYEDFQSEADKIICQPMKEILACYETLQVTASEEALKRFLTVFKEHHVQLPPAVVTYDLYVCHEIPSPQVAVTDGVWPANLEDSSQTVINTDVYTFLVVDYSVEDFPRHRQKCDSSVVGTVAEVSLGSFMRYPSLQSDGTSSFSHEYNRSFPSEVDANEWLLPVIHLMMEAVKRLSLHLEDKQGAEAISAFGEDFLQSLGKLRVDQQNKRDTCLDDLDVARQQYNSYKDELRKVFLETNSGDSCHSDVDVIQMVGSPSEQIDGETSENSQQRKTTTDGNGIGLHTPQQVDVKGVDKEAGSLDDGVRCICGVECEEREKTIDTDNPDHINDERKVIAKRGGSDGNADGTTQDNKLAAVSRRRRPPRMMKGIPPSKLVLNKKPPNASEEDSSRCHKSDELDHECEDDFRSAQSLSDIPQGSLDSYCDNGPTVRVRSGSLSRSFQRPAKPSHLEPLVSPLTSLRVDYRSSPSSKPWK
ncbi:hypothetical protein LSH36_909g00018 [Paralvinella palmiformis]|uniref:Uncharacterized protein n=1 Tax=Paralvinella palmiformis TaxID=53620 RepID=A0AAD9IXL5_9ANNE|nr:hypothetical protein LSH36_909g00018 [Paralvinella palmiformis]